MPSPLAELLSALALAFRRLSLRWYLFGAQAAILHGAARLTGDVDATVDLGARSPAELLAALSAEGFAPRVSDVEGFLERTRVLPVVYERTEMPVDIVLAGPGLEERFLERAEECVVEGVAISIACAEDIVAMKILAGRPKDIDDAVAVLAARGPAVRLALIRETLGILEEALGRSDLLPALEYARERART